MYTDVITTTAFVVVPTNTVELSTYDFCNWLDHHIFKDTSLTPTGYNFFYPLTAFGGTYFDVNYTTTVSGGPFYDYCYQDFCFEKFSLNAINLYCVANVNFVLSAFDETQAKLIRLVYDFNDDTPKVVKNFNYISPQQTLIRNEIVSHIYYPTEQFVTTYRPSITAIYEDGCINVVTLTLNSYKCGIYDAFKDVALLDSAQTKNTNNIILTLEDRKRLQVFTNILDLNAQTATLLDLASGETAQQLLDTVTVVKASSARIQFLNPVVVDPATYEYVEGPGINLTPDNLRLLQNDLIVSLSGDIVFEENTGAPYVVGDGIIVTPGFLRTTNLD